MAVRAASGGQQRYGVVDEAHPVGGEVGHRPVRLGVAVQGLGRPVQINSPVNGEG